MIEIEEIMEFLNGHSKPLKGAREIIQANYLLKVGYTKENADHIELKGACIQVSHPGNVPFEPTVVIKKLFPGSAERGYCPCEGDASGKCKLVVSILRSVEKWVHYLITWDRNIVQSH